MTDPVILKLQRDSLRDALQKVLDTRAKEAAARMSYENALANFGPDGGKSREGKAHMRAMVAASDAEREARVLLLTLKQEETKP